MNIAITPELERFVQAKVASGMYPSANELVREALCLLEERDASQQRRREELNQMIQIAMDQGARGEVISAEESKKKLAEFKTDYFNTKK